MYDLRASRHCFLFNLMYYLVMRHYMALHTLPLVLAILPPQKSTLYYYTAVILILVSCSSHQFESPSGIS